MGEGLLRQLAVLDLEDVTTAPLRLVRGPLQLRRAWPRSKDHLLLEYVDRAGGIVSGQWIDDEELLHHIADETARRCPQAPPAIVRCNGASALLQPNGGDRRLRCLPALLSDPAATLIAHRPERRAVVRLQASGQERFVKVVRPTNVQRLAEGMRHVWAISDRLFTLPEVLEVDQKRGTLTCGAISGTCLFDRLTRSDLHRALRSVGNALRGLHDAAAPDNPLSHPAEAEIDLLQKQLDRLSAFAPALWRKAREKAGDVFCGLEDGSSPNAVLHRDFYDKQIFIQGDGSVALLDFDTLAIGEAAVDVANMLGHLELRVLQGRCGHDASVEGSAGFLAGYGPPPAVRRRVPPYLDATRLRLACLYVFRPNGAALCGALLDRIGAPHAAR